MRNAPHAGLGVYMVVTCISHLYPRIQAPSGIYIIIFLINFIHIAKVHSPCMATCLSTDIPGQLN